jgi:hypothetical protein
MLNWIYNWFSTTYHYPARNAPNNGIDVKKFIENKPSEVKLISLEDINNIKNNLHKIEIPERPSDFPGSPLMTEFHNVFNMGYKNFLEQRKSSRKNL